MSADAERVVREGLVAAGRRLAQLGLIAGTEGNLSARVDPERIVVTPTSVAKGELTPDDLVLLEVATGEAPPGLGPDDLGGAPTSELGMHLALYRRPYVEAVIHAHPPYATAFAAAGISLDPPALSEQTMFLGEVPLLPFAVPGTPDVAARVDTLSDPCHAFLLSNHGATTTGATIERAMQRMEILESCARVTWLARSLDPDAGLNEEQVRRLEADRPEEDWDRGGA